MPSSRRLLAKVGPHHVGVVDDVLGPAIGNLAPRDQYSQPLREAHDRPHDVLDHDDGDALRIETHEQGDDVLDLGMRKASHGFIGNQKLRLCRHRARKLQLAHFHLSEITGAAPGLAVEPDLPQKVEAALIELGRRADQQRASPDRIEQRDAQILSHGEADKRSWQLEAAREPHVRAPMGRQTIEDLTREPYRTRLIVERAAHAVNEGALAGAIRADEPEALAGGHVKVDPLKRHEAAEALGKPPNLKQRCGHGFLRVCCQSKTRPMIPLGAMTTNTTSSTPTSRRLTAEEMVTVAICCMEPSRIAPMRGPAQLVVPPIIGMAIELTAYCRPKVPAGST